MPTVVSDPTQLSIAELGFAFRARRLTPLEATEACLARIAARDPELHAFITVTGDAARDAARTAGKELANGHDRGPLHGVPIALKDLIDTAGVRTTCASALFADRVPTDDATVVQRLHDAGAVLLGKLNLHELAYGGSGVIGHYPATRNPKNPGHIAGGSSSGSAAAVAARLCYAALGTDTAGSIRVPAALCGVVGLKPSYGLVPLRGVFPLAWTYDHVGPITRTVHDAALVLQVIAGHDADDVTSLALPVPDYAAIAGLDVPDTLRIGVARPYFFNDALPEVVAAIDRALAIAAGLGAILRDVELPIDDDRTVARTESFAIHRRWVKQSPERYQAPTLARINTGASVSASDYIEKLHELQLMRRRAAALFTDVDLIVMPTTPIPAPSFAEIEAAPETLRSRELVLLRNTRPFNILGTPALSIPCGATRTGLPLGIQIVGAPGADATVLRFGATLERHLSATA
ncbi:MAG TPA: amidase [Kofleriaceae bacterium]|jgi:aspartyl-tRNA(Asn)/glutamyl-tRNA(Gln) amidotransferase subunit A|nr:amidase [Kofleriaceae bacterium]